MDTIISRSNMLDLYSWIGDTMINIMADPSQYELAFLAIVQDIIGDYVPGGPGDTHVRGIWLEEIAAAIKEVAG